MKNKGNTILITGGTSGIGLELVKRFYGLGNKLIVVSGNMENLVNVKKQFSESIIVECNLADSNSVQQLILKCNHEFKDINILINNAGVQYNYDWLKEKDGYRKIADEIAINLTSPLQLIYGLLPILCEKETAAIVNVSSGLAYAPKMAAPVYCGTKAAIHNTTKALRYQLEDTSIKLFEIVPSLIDTPMTEGRGRSKISPEQLVNEFMNNFKKDKLESNIDKVKFMKFAHRFYPSLVEKMMKGSM